MISAENSWFSIVYARHSGGLWFRPSIANSNFDSVASPTFLTPREQRLCISTACDPDTINLSCEDRKFSDTVNFLVATVRNALATTQDAKLPVERTFDYIIVPYFNMLDSNYADVHPSPSVLARHFLISPSSQQTTRLIICVLEDQLKDAVQLLGILTHHLSLRHEPLLFVRHLTGWYTANRSGQPTSPPHFACPILDVGSMALHIAYRKSTSHCLLVTDSYHVLVSAFASVLESLNLKFGKFCRNYHCCIFERKRSSPRATLPYLYVDILMAGALIRGSSLGRSYNETSSVWLTSFVYSQLPIKNPHIMQRLNSSPTLRTEYTAFGETVIHIKDDQPITESIQTIYQALSWRLYFYCNCYKGLALQSPFVSV